MTPEINLDVDKNDITAHANEKNGSEQEDGFINELDASEDEDVNDIRVTDKESPIVLLFGPTSCGKSMTLVRLSRYLRKIGYKVEADTKFRSDDDYKKKCTEFKDILGTQKALPSTPYKDFLLVKVFKGKRLICQFIEAPGEHYFNPKNIDATYFPPYMTEIIRNLNNRKIWVFMTVAEWQVRNNVISAYVSRIENCRTQLVQNIDRSIILYNMVDKKGNVLFDNGKIIVPLAEKFMKEEYDGLATLFANNNPITKLWRKYNYKFVPFCTGYYEKDTNRYTPSEDIYPQMLWNALMKCFKG